MDVLIEIFNEQKRQMEVMPLTTDTVMETCIESLAALATIIKGVDYTKMPMAEYNNMMRGLLDRYDSQSLLMVVIVSTCNILQTLRELENEEQSKR